MPEYFATGRETLSGPLQDFGGLGCNMFLKKRTMDRLPYRTDSHPEPPRNLAKHTRVKLSRRAAATSTDLKADSAQRRLEQAARRRREEEESDDEVEELVRSEPKGRQQHLATSLAQSRSSLSHITLRRGPRSIQRYTQERLQLARYSDNPFKFLGPGESDPFAALPSDLPRSFLDERLYGCREPLAQLVSRGTSGGIYGKSFSMNVMSSITTNPALFYAVMSVELTYSRVLSGVTHGQAIELEVGTRAIQHMSREMRDPNRAVLDSNIWAVFILGYSGREAPLRVSPYPRQSFLRELQSINIYCRLEIVLEHVYGLIKLIELLGGLRNIKTPGMAQSISFAGIMGACRSLQKPIFPFLAHSKTFMDDGRLSVSDQEREWVVHTLGCLGSGFWEVWGPYVTGELDDLRVVIQHVCDFTIVVENHAQGRWMPRTFTVIIDQRNFVQHNLMSLKTKQELSDSKSVVDEPLYECCRLGAIAYSFLVVFPIPPVAGPFEALTEQLRAELIEVGMNCDAESRSRLLLWILVMGAIAATGLPDRPWFCSQIQILSAEMGIGEWEELKEILQSFLWLPSTSDPDGRELWTEMQAEGLSAT